MVHVVRVLACCCMVHVVREEVHVVSVLGMLLHGPCRERRIPRRESAGMLLHGPCRERRIPRRESAGMLLHGPCRERRSPRRESACMLLHVAELDAQIATVAVSSSAFPDLYPFLRPCQS